MHHMQDFYAGICDPVEDQIFADGKAAVTGPQFIAPAKWGLSPSNRKYCVSKSRSDLLPIRRYRQCSARSRAHLDVPAESVGMSSGLLVVALRASLPFQLVGKFRQRLIRVVRVAPGL